MKDLDLKMEMTCQLCDGDCPKNAVTKCNFKHPDFTGCGKRFCADHGHPPFHSHANPMGIYREGYKKKVSPALQKKKFGELQKKYGVPLTIEN